MSQKRKHSQVEKSFDDAEEQPTKKLICMQCQISLII